MQTHHASAAQPPPVIISLYRPRQKVGLVPFELTRAELNTISTQTACGSLFIFLSCFSLTLFPILTRSSIQSVDAPPSLPPSTVTHNTRPPARNSIYIFMTIHLYPMARRGPPLREEGLINSLPWASLNSPVVGENKERQSTLSAFEGGRRFARARIALYGVLRKQGRPFGVAEELWDFLEGARDRFSYGILCF